MTHDVSHSELDALRQCAFKHQLAYRELWQPKVVARALARGTLWHRILEIHYRTKGNIPWGPQEEDEPPREIDHCLYDVNGEQSEDQETCEWMYDGYLERYGDDPEWEIVDVEFKVRYWMLNERGNRTGFRMNGTVDLLVRDWSAGGTLWGVDHKSISRRDLSKPLEKDLDFDDQSGIYTLGVRRAGQDIRGFIFSHARTDRLVRELSLDERFRRTFTVRSDRELRTMEMEALEIFRRGYHRSPLGGATAPRSPNPDTCNWRCPFTSPCLMSRKGTPIEDLLEDMDYQKGEPRY